MSCRCSIPSKIGMASRKTRPSRIVVRKKAGLTSRVAVAPQRKAGPEAGRAGDIGGVDIAERSGQPDFFLLHGRAEHEESDQREQGGQHQAAGLGAHAERPEKAEDIQRVSTERIGPHIDDLRLLAAPDIERAPGASDDTDGDGSEAGQFQPLMQVGLAAKRLGHRDQGDRGQDAGEQNGFADQLDPTQGVDGGTQRDGGHEGLRMLDLHARVWSARTTKVRAQGGAGP